MSSFKGQRSAHKNLRRVEGNFQYSQRSSSSNGSRGAQDSHEHQEELRREQQIEQQREISRKQEFPALNAVSIEQAVSQLKVDDSTRYQRLIIRLGEACLPTAFEETKQILNRYQVSQADPKAVLTSVTELNGIQRALKIIPIFIELITDSAKKENLVRRFVDYKIMAKEFPTLQTQNFETQQGEQQQERQSRVLVIKNHPVAKGKNKASQFPSLPKGSGSSSSAGTSSKKEKEHLDFSDAVHPFGKVEKELERIEDEMNPYKEHEYFQARVSEKDFPSLPGQSLPSGAKKGEPGFTEIREWSDPFNAGGEGSDNFLIGHVPAEKPAEKKGKKGKVTLYRFG